MTSRRAPRTDNPSRAPIEALLREIAAGTTDRPVRRGDLILTTHAVVLCACETFDDSDTWVVHAVGDDGVGWVRLPEGSQVEDEVVAEHVACHHPAPEGVLDWLLGDDPDPWRSQSDPAGQAVFAEIHRRIRDARSPGAVVRT